MSDKKESHADSAEPRRLRINLRGQRCAKRYENKIKPFLCGMRPVQYEFIIVDYPSDYFNFIQSYVMSGGRYRVEFWSDTEAVCLNGLTKAQAEKTFYDVCILKKGRLELEQFGLPWIDVITELNMYDIVRKYQEDRTTPRQDAIYTEALLYLIEKFQARDLYEKLARYYEKIGAYALSKKYEAIAKRQKTNYEQRERSY